VNKIESDPEILGGIVIIRGTRIPCALIYELIGLHYTIDEISEESLHLDKKILLKVIEVRNTPLIF